MLTLYITVQTPTSPSHLAQLSSTAKRTDERGITIPSAHGELRAATLVLLQLTDVRFLHSAADIGDVTPGQSAPGVSFAPSNDNVRVRTKEELEGWTPAPRRTQSQRAPRGPPISSENRKVSNGGLNRSRAGSASIKNVDGSEAGELKNGSQADSKAVGEVRRGVQLEDKPLSRKTSVKRAASAMRKAAEKAFTFEPLAKEEGEKRVLILMADGSEEMETVIIYDILVRASLHPTLVSVSPQFSPSQSLPVSSVNFSSARSSSLTLYPLSHIPHLLHHFQYVTLSRGAKMMADTQFETLKQEHKDDFDALVRSSLFHLPFLTTSDTYPSYRSSPEAPKEPSKPLSVALRCLRPHR